MHPKLMIALAQEVDRERRGGQRKLKARTQALVGRPRGVRPAGRLARRLTVGIGLRPRLS